MTINAINNIQFGKTEKPKKVREYQRTDAYKIAGAAIGLVSGGLTSYAGIKGVEAYYNAPLKEITNMKAGKIVAMVMAATTVLGFLTGALTDGLVNKIVKNTTKSIKGENKEV